MTLPTFTELPVDVAAAGLREHLLGRPGVLGVTPDERQIPADRLAELKILEHNRGPVAVLVVEVAPGCDRRALPRAWPDAVAGHPVVTRVPRGPEGPAAPGGRMRRVFGGRRGT
jgi:hypothetical protein